MLPLTMLKEKIAKKTARSPTLSAPLQPPCSFTSQNQDKVIAFLKPTNHLVKKGGFFCAFSHFGRLI